MGSVLTGVRPRVSRLPQRVVALALAVVNLGRPRLFLQTTPTSRFRYYVSLPRGWTPGRRWPILVTIDGANHGFFLPHALAFLRAQQDRPFIIVTPCVVSNTGRPDRSAYPHPTKVWHHISRLSALGSDADGLQEAVAAVRAAYNTEERFFLTGWSAGGHLTWYLIFTYPECLTAAVPVCANFAGRGIPAAAPPDAQRQVQVHALQGQNDRLRVALDAQWARALALAEARGYRNITRDLLEGVGHSACAAQVLDLCHNIWQAQARDHGDGEPSIIGGTQ